MRGSVGYGVKAPAYVFSVLGPVEHVVDGQTASVGGPRHRAILAVLLLRANNVVPTTDLIDELWPDHPPETALNALQGYVSHLRKVLQPPRGGTRPRLATRASGYVLALHENELDLHRHEHLLESARHALANDDAAGAAVSLREALSLWRGEPFAGAQLGPFLTAERLRLEELRAATVEERLAADLALGRAPKLVGELRALVEEHPFRERLRGLLMTAFYLSGRQAEALDAYWAARRVFMDELGIEPTVELQRLQQAILRQDPSLEPTLERASSPPRLRLPAPASPMIARESEIVALGKLLTDERTRLVTITGLGGVGKTRLALEVARRIEAEFAGGAAFVGLDSVREAPVVAAALCEALGIRGHDEVSRRDALLLGIGDRQLLLVVDNFEHVLEAGELLATLLAACPAVTLLVTSRAPLRLAGEQEFLLSPLPVPTSLDMDVGDLVSVPAVALFVDRSQAVRPGFEVTAANARSIAELCGRLDGLPLALELAAARTKVLGPKALLERLDERFSLLAGRRRDVPARHETLRATLDWSYELLSEPERSLLARLSIFAGGFTIDAAERVCGEEKAGVLDRLESLIDNALIFSDPASQGRFRMLETIREYGILRLAEAGESDNVAEAHLSYFLGLVTEAEPELTGSRHREWLERLELEHDNLRVAFYFALSRGDGRRALRMACAMRRFLRVKGHLSEGRQMFEAALALAPAGEAELRASAYNGLGALAGEQGDFVAAEEAFTRASELVDDVPGSQLAAATRANLGNIALFAGDHRRARQCFEQALEIWQGLGDERATAVALENLGCVALAEDRIDDADELLAESERIARVAANELNLAATLAARGRVLVLSGELEEAQRLLDESLELGASLGGDHPIADSLDGLAGVAAARGDHERAAMLAGAGDAAWSHLSARRPPDQQAWRDRVLAPVVESLGEASFERVRTRGSSLTREDAIEYAHAPVAAAQLS